MIGIIVSGHGQFATGLKSALTLIAGEKNNIEFIDFDCPSIQELENRFTVAIERLNGVDSILALCDLTGGSPFKTVAVMLNQLEKEAEVIGGVNLPILIELSLARDFIEDVHQLADMALQTGKNNITKFEMPQVEIEEEGDGI